jgi:hypothetical protein
MSKKSQPLLQSSNQLNLQQQNYMNGLLSQREKADMVSLSNLLSMLLLQKQHY